MYKTVAINIDSPADIVQIHKFCTLMVPTNTHKYNKIRFIRTVKYYMFRPTMWSSAGNKRIQKPQGGAQQMIYISYFLNKIR